MDGVVLCGAPLEMFTTDPPPSARPPDRAACSRASAGQVLRATVSTKPARSITSNEPAKCGPPIVFTRWSIRPKCSVAAWTRRTGVPSSSIDPATATTLIPRAKRARSVAANVAGSRPLITTEAPSRPKRTAQERPMLGSAEEPGTTATRPLNRLPY